MAQEIYFSDTDYFETVAFDYIIEAVRTASQELKKPLSKQNIKCYAEFIKEFVI